MGAQAQWGYKQRYPVVQSLNCVEVEMVVVVVRQQQEIDRREILRNVIVGACEGFSKKATGDA